MNCEGRTANDHRPSTKKMVRKGGLEPPRFYPPDPKSGASANSATFARAWLHTTAFVRDREDTADTLSVSAPRSELGTVAASRQWRDRVRRPRSDIPPPTATGSALPQRIPSGPRVSGTGYLVLAHTCAARPPCSSWPVPETLFRQPWSALLVPPDELRC